jgi:4-amino-4-deoxy-L-arabinose transferase-like glycosyltransferase
MAESTAQLFLMLAILTIVRLTLLVHGDGPARWRRWSIVVAGIALGLAVAAKQSAIAVVPVALFVAAIVATLPRAPIRRTLAIAALNAAVLGVVSLLTYFVVNPVLYSQPLHAGRTMIGVRRSLTRNQAASLENVGSRQSLPTMRSRLNAAYREVFWNPPDPSESASGAEEARGARTWEPRPLTLLWDGTWFRWSFLTFSVLGLGSAIQTIIRGRFGRPTWLRQIVVLWLLVEIVFVTLFIPMDWQRHFLTLLAPTCIFTALGASWLVDRVRLRRGAKTNRKSAAPI